MKLGSVLTVLVFLLVLTLQGASGVGCDLPEPMCPDMGDAPWFFDSCPSGDCTLVFY